MGFKYTYELLPGATKDFQEIYDHIANVFSNETAAIKLSGKFREAIKLTCEFPKMHTVYKGHRRIVIDDYLVFYKIDEKERILIITCACHGSMDYDRILRTRTLS